MFPQHEWFIKFHSSYEDANCVYIAMDDILIGDMSKTFVNNYQWNESDTKVVIQQLLQGLAVMHQEGITHRDPKPEVCSSLIRGTVGIIGCCSTYSTYRICT